MGTRSLINFKDDGVVICCVYRQMDGYPTGRGKELADFLKGISIVNGYSYGAKAGEQANGMGCLVAQWIAKEKNGIGNVYVMPPGAKDCWEEFTYTVEDSAVGVMLTVADGYDRVFFSNQPKFYDEWLETRGEEE